MSQETLSRRDFLKLTALVAGSILLPSCSQVENPDQETTNRILTSLNKYYPELQSQNILETDMFRPTENTDWVYIFNYTDANIQYKNLENVYTFFDQTLQKSTHFSYTDQYGNNETISYIPRPGKSVIVFIPESIPPPNWPDNRSTSGGTLIVPSEQIQISFVRFDPKNPSKNEVNRTALIESCQARVEVITTPNPNQEILCNSIPREMIARASGLSYPAYVEDAKSRYLVDFTGTRIPLLIFPDQLYKATPRIAEIIQ